MWNIDQGSIAGEGEDLERGREKLNYDAYQTAVAGSCRAAGSDWSRLAQEVTGAGWHLGPKLSFQCRFASKLTMQDLAAGTSNSLKWHLDSPSSCSQHQHGDNRKYLPMTNEKMSAKRLTALFKTYISEKESMPKASVLTLLGVFLSFTSLVLL